MAKSKSVTVATPEARLSFPRLDKPHSGFEGQVAKFSADLLFAPGANLKVLKDAAGAVAKAKWGSDLPKGLRSPFKDAGEKENLDGYEEGMTYLTVKNEKKPTLVDRGLNDVDADYFYPGCYVIAVLSCYAYDRAGNKGVTFSLKTLQFAKDGENFAGGSGRELLSAIEDEGKIIEDDEEEEVGEDGDSEESPW